MWPGGISCMRFNNIVAPLTAEAANLHNQQIKMIESWRRRSGGNIIICNVSWLAIVIILLK